MMQEGRVFQTIIAIALLLLTFISESENAAPKKPRYMLANDKAELEYYNHTCGKDINFSFRQVNQVQFGLTASFTTLREFGDDVSVDAKIYKQQGNSYKLIPFNLKSNVCKIWKTNMMGFAGLKNYGNITGCGIKANTHYYLNDYVPDLENFPPVLPLGTYKLDIQFFHNKVNLFILKWYARVLPPKE